MAPPTYGPCPVCGALTAVAGPVHDQHLDWHEKTNTWPEGATLPGDDSPTQKFPPISETVLRRPPPPAVRELRGSELLRALAEELARDERDAGYVCPQCGPDPRGGEAHAEDRHTL